MSMRKIILITLVALFPFCTYNASAHYNVAIMITSPLSAASKQGGMLEIRGGNSAFLIGLTNYSGVYKGKAYKLEYHNYFRNRISDNFFWYLKVGGGQSTYNPTAFSLLDDKTNALQVPYDYYFGGAGFGRRYTRGKHLCLTLSLGLKYTALPEDMSDEQKDNYRIFYATGPGSVIDANIRIGYQF